MADLGTLTVVATISTRAAYTIPGWDLSNPITRTALPAINRGALPVWAQPVLSALPVLISGSISGTVSNGATPVVGYQVRCYYRRTGYAVATAITDANGAYQFVNLDPTDQYMIVAVDAANASNAVIQDYAVPTDLGVLASAAMAEARAQGTMLVNGV